MVIMAPKYLFHAGYLFARPLAPASKRALELLLFHSCARLARPSNRRHKLFLNNSIKIAALPPPPLVQLGVKRQRRSRSPFGGHHLSLPPEPIALARSPATSGRVLPAPGGSLRVAPSFGRQFGGGQAAAAAAVAVAPSAGQFGPAGRPSSRVGRRRRGRRRGRSRRQPARPPTDLGQWQA